MNTQTQTPGTGTNEKPRSEKVNLGRIIWDKEGNVKYKDEWGTLQCKEFPYEDRIEDFVKVLEWEENAIEIFIRDNYVIIIEITPEDSICYTLPRNKLTRYIMAGKMFLLQESSEGEA